jgi:predicted  nucleic acid-binding Zn-ribbon protein
MESSDSASSRYIAFLEGEQYSLNQRLGELEREVLKTQERLESERNDFRLLKEKSNMQTRSLSMKNAALESAVSGLEENAKRLKARIRGYEDILKTFESSREVLTELESDYQQFRKGCLGAEDDR